MDTKTFRAVAVVTVLCGLVLWGALGMATADISPSGCDTNGLDMTLSRTPSVAHNGDTISYVVRVSNGAFPACDVTSLVADFIAPAADGTATGATTNLDAGSTFIPSASTTYPTQNVVLALNPGVATATAKSTYAGLLHDAPGNDVVSGQKTVTITIVNPSISVTKVATPTASKVGDTVDYEICVTNTGDITLENITVVDGLLGDLSASFADSLTPGASECHTFPYVVQPGDPDPLLNTVTVEGTDVAPGVANFQAKTVSDTADATVDLVHPSFTISKACSPDPVAAGGTLTWTITLVNTGDISLDIHTVDPTAGVDEVDTVAAGATKTISATHVVVAGDISPIANTATATATLTGDILPNVIGPQSSSSSCAIQIQTGGPTRTPGYWFTHPTALLAAYDCITGSPSGTITLCAGTCTATANDAMAIFWKTSGSNRPTLAQQILAAMFNQCVLGTTAPDSIIQNGLDVLCNPNATNDEIGAVIGPLDAFNNSGDDLPFPPGMNFGNANPKTAKSMANAGTVPSCAAGTK